MARERAVVQRFGLIRETSRECACGAPIFYDAEHDAYLCPGCDKWETKVCRLVGGGGCEFCSNRPEKPSQVPDVR